MLAVCQYGQLTLNNYKMAVAQKPNMSPITGVYVENDGRLSAGEGRKQSVVEGIENAVDAIIRFKAPAPSVLG